MQITRLKKSEEVDAACQSQYPHVYAAAGVPQCHSPGRLWSVEGGFLLSQIGLVKKRGKGSKRSPATV